MYPAGNLFIPAQHGRLEAILKEPRGIAARGVALVLHPLPTGGGTMHNKVVFRAASALNDAGLSTLRINFRGVGQSTGNFDHGRGELEDARNALAYLVNHYKNLPVTICGFSFGAFVGTQVGIADPVVSDLISIGSPVDKYSFSFLQHCRKPILFVHGDEDQFGSVREIERMVGKLEQITNAELKVIKGASHFFEGHLDELKGVITDWARERLETRTETR